MVTEPGGEEEAVLKHLLVGGVKQEERPNCLSCPLKVPSYKQKSLTQFKTKLILLSLSTDM